MSLGLEAETVFVKTSMLSMVRWPEPSMSFLAIFSAGVDWCAYLAAVSLTLSPRVL